MVRLVQWYFSLALLSLIGLLVITPFDQSIASYFQAHRSASFAEFCDRSLFEGEALGMTDLVNFVLVGVLLTFLISSFSNSPVLRRLKGDTGFVLIAALTLGVTIVHGLKYVLARVRPYDLSFNNHFSPWYMLGNHEWGTKYHGSFPSGHTATMMGLLLLSVFVEQKRWQGAIIGVTMILALTVGITRVMVGAHWPTDIVGAMFLSSLCFGVLSFARHKMTDQPRNDEPS